MIPTYNRARLLRSTLESLERIRIPPGVPVEIVVINNNCTDDTPQVIEEFAGRGILTVRTVSETRQGVGAARNRALVESSYDNVVFFDDDVEVAPEWFEGYLEARRTFHADCVIGPVVPVFEFGIPPHATPRVLESVASPYSRKGEIAGVMTPAASRQLPGCNFGVRLAAAIDVKGFNASLDRSGNILLGAGDWEFGQRLVLNGKRVVYEPRCLVKHVITADKLNPRSLRSRWYNLGVAHRFMHEAAGHSMPLFPSLRGVLRGVHKLAGSVALRAAGKPAAAFERELEALKDLGFVAGGFRTPPQFHAGLKVSPATSPPLNLRGRTAAAIPFRLLTTLSGLGGTAISYHMVSNIAFPHVWHLYPYKTPEQFEGDIRMIQQNARLATYDELVAAGGRISHLPRGSVLLTLDDGYSQCFSVVRPLLLKHGVPCIFFITTDWVSNRSLFFRNKVSLCIEKLVCLPDDQADPAIGALREVLGMAEGGGDAVAARLLALRQADEHLVDRAGTILELDWQDFLARQQPYLTANEIRQLAADGFCIGAHGRGHPRMGRFTRDELDRELSGSLKAVREWTGQARMPFAFPHEESSPEDVLSDVIQARPDVCGIFGRPPAGARSSLLIPRIGMDDPGPPLAGPHLIATLRRHHRQALVARLKAWRRWTAPADGGRGA